MWLQPGSEKNINATTAGNTIRDLTDSPFLKIQIIFKSYLFSAVYNFIRDI